MAMLTMDVFKQDAFSATSLTAFVDKMGYTPQFLFTMQGLFVPTPIRTTAVFIEERSNDAALIQTTPRGAPPPQKGGDLRTVRAFSTRRVAQKSRITADELQNIRAPGSETELKSLEQEVRRRQAKMQGDVDLTMENLCLGAVQGLVADADGSTIYDWAAEFSQAIPGEVDFDLDNASPAAGVLRKRCTAAVRSITRSLKGLGGNGVRVMALCGDDFWDNLIAHQEVRQTYLNYAAAATLRDPVAWEVFNFGGITWTNYRGTDDGTTVAVGAAKAKFFPVNAGIFQMAYAPAETFDFVNTLGQPRYSWIVTDKDRNAWADVEMYSYPLPVCTMPSALYQARYT
jgi:hypothetical protein